MGHSVTNNLDNLARFEFVFFPPLLQPSAVNSQCLGNILRVDVAPLRGKLLEVVAVVGEQTTLNLAFKTLWLSFTTSLFIFSNTSTGSFVSSFASLPCL